MKIYVYWVPSYSKVERVKSEPSPLIKIKNLKQVGTFTLEFSLRKKKGFNLLNIHK